MLYIVTVRIDADIADEWQAWGRSGVVAGYSRVEKP